MSTHIMHLEETYPSKAERWRCPVCNRQFILQWPAKKIVLEDGDDYIQHNCIKSADGVEMVIDTVDTVEPLPEAFNDFEWQE